VGGDRLDRDDGGHHAIQTRDRPERSGPTNHFTPIPTSPGGSRWDPAHALRPCDLLRRRCSRVHRLSLRERSARLNQERGFEPNEREGTSMAADEQTSAREDPAARSLWRARHGCSRCGRRQPRMARGHGRPPPGTGLSRPRWGEATSTSTCWTARVRGRFSPSWTR